MFLFSLQISYNRSVSQFLCSNLRISLSCFQCIYTGVAWHTCIPIILFHYIGCIIVSVLFISYCFAPTRKIFVFSCVFHAYYYWCLLLRYGSYSIIFSRTATLHLKNHFYYLFLLAMYRYMRLNRSRNYSRWPPRSFVLGDLSGYFYFK